MLSPALHKPLIQHLVPVKNLALRTLLQITLGVAFVALLAQIEINIGPVPLSGQTLGVLLIGATYGMSLGAITLLSYLTLGAFGVGVFSGGGAGLATLTGTTAGYLAGFVIAAAVVGYLAQRGWDKQYASMALAMVIGNLIIYATGLAWLNQFAPDFQTTLQWGLLPFIPGDILKIMLAMSLLPTIWKFLGKRA